MIVSRKCGLCSQLLFSILTTYQASRCIYLFIFIFVTNFLTSRHVLWFVIHRRYSLYKYTLALTSNLWLLQIIIVRGKKQLVDLTILFNKTLKAHFYERTHQDNTATIHTRSDIEHSEQYQIMITSIFYFDKQFDSDQI